MKSLEALPILIIEETTKWISMSWYARVCQNGHVLDTSTSPKDNWNLNQPAFCPKCGTKAFKICPDCNESYIPVSMEYHSVRDLDKRDIPNYCPGCGIDFPWTDPIAKQETRDGEFIEISNEEISGGFYIKLVSEINKCYCVNANNATYILYRKLLENLIYDSLRAYYGPEEMDLYFDKENGMRQNFNTLIESLKHSTDEFKRFSSAMGPEFIHEIRRFQNKGNSSAHDVNHLVKDDEIENKSEDATHVARVLFRLRENIYVQN